jgi:hypothetical protein
MYDCDWDVTTYSLIVRNSVSEELDASIFRLEE